MEDISLTRLQPRNCRNPIHHNSNTVCQQHVIPTALSSTRNNTMKIALFASLIVAALVPSLQAAAPPSVLAIPRGGAAIGPLDGDMALKLSKTAATAYVAGSASKYIAKETGGSSHVRTELFLSVMCHHLGYHSLNRRSCWIYSWLLS